MVAGPRVGGGRLGDEAQAGEGEAQLGALPKVDDVRMEERGRAEPDRATLGGADRGLIERTDRIHHELERRRPSGSCRWRKGRARS